MAVKLRRVSCGHRKIGQDGPAIEVFLVTSDGKRRSVGKVCRRCAAAWGPTGLGEFSMLYLFRALAHQPRLGDVQITFDGIEAMYSADRRAELVSYLERARRVWSKQHEWLDIRDLGWSVPSAELERRITFKV
jgi:hypothetical protein